MFEGLDEIIVHFLLFLAAGLVFGQDTAPSSYTVKDVFLFGGKTAAQPEDIPGERNLFEKAWNRVVTTLEVKNPPQYAAITVQKNVVQTVPPGEAPPPAQIAVDTTNPTPVPTSGYSRFWP